MTQTSRPWTGRTSEGAPGDAGAYSASDWQAIWRSWFGQSKANRGVLRDVDNELAVSASSPADTNVNVATGAAQVNGIWYLNNASVAVAITSNSSGLTRIDAVVLEADYTAQTIRITVVQGTPGAGLPTLTQDALIWQIPLAYLTLATGFTSIAASAITDLRSYANISSAIGINVLNGSGATLEQGAAVIWHAGGIAQINTTTTEGDKNVAGIIEARVLNGAYGRIITQGVISVMCDEAVSVGQLLELSTTAGQAQGSVRGSTFARVLTANTGAGTRCLAYVNVKETASDMVTGFYSGNNAATQAITGLGFRPRLVQIWTTSAVAPAVYIAQKTDRDGVNAMVSGRNGGGDTSFYGADMIISLDSDGFTVGDGTPAGYNFMNATGNTYMFVVWR